MGHECRLGIRVNVSRFAEMPNDLAERMIACWHALSFLKCFTRSALNFD